MWELKNAYAKNNYHSIYFSPSNYCGKWRVPVRSIEKQDKVLDILYDTIVDKRTNDVEEDFEDADVPLKEFSGDEDLGKG